MTKDTDPGIGLPSTRVEAKLIGEKYFFTGVACTRGHFSKRYTSNGWCAECAKEDVRLAARRRREADKEAVNRSQREWREKNPDKVKEWKAEWQRNNPDLVKAARKRFLDARPGYELVRSRKRREKATDDDRAKRADQMAKWRENNPERNKESQKRANIKRLSSPKGKLESAIRNGINAEIRKGTKKGRRTFDLLDYTIEELKDHIERQFQSGMSWNNHGTGEGKWHIDHIVPLSAHNYETPDDIDFKKAWALSNLQPMWAKENMSKGAKIKGGFQPSLALAIPADNDNSPSKRDETA